MPMSNLSFQYQDCTKTLAEGLEEYKQHVGEKYIDALSLEKTIYLVHFILGGNIAFNCLMSL